MPQISNRPSEALSERLKDRANQHLDDRQLRHLVEKIKDQRAEVSELRLVKTEALNPDTKEALAKFLAEQLKGQIPAGLAKGLIGGKVDDVLLQKLTDRLANSANPGSLVGRAATPESARAQAADQSVPQQALRWVQFVQRPQHVPGANVQQRAGVASPKGEGTTLAEMLGQKLSGSEGPGLRAPRLVQKAMGDLSPAQKSQLMRATFGQAMAAELEALGIEDPLQLVREGALPAGRESLAKSLNIPRARLLGMLLHAEMLKIGPGRNGELGMRPEFLGPLKQAGVAMLATLAALRALSPEELKHIYNILRQGAGGFRNIMRGARPPVKRDLLHWARTAARSRSEILFADSDEHQRRGGYNRADAQELIQAWYYENLLWQELASARRRQQELQEQLHQRIVREDAEQERRREQQRQQQDDEDSLFEDGLPELVYDEDRNDHLMCFWITDYDVRPDFPSAARRMYVCIDPQTGAIIPQQIEREEIPSP